MKQQTFRNSGIISGTAIHNGRKSVLRIEPLEEDTGIVFISSHGKRINANIRYADDYNQNTTILRKDGTSIYTIEHVMSALRGCGVDNAAVILMYNEELPFLDGSALEWLKFFESLGVQQQSKDRAVFGISHEIHCVFGSSRFSARPSERFEVECKIEFSECIIGSQTFPYNHSAQNYANQIAPARSFLRDPFEWSAISSISERLKGLCFDPLGGGSNLILYNKERYFSPLRFETEPVRHKILDFIGDFYLCGHPVAGHFEIVRPGHKSNLAFTRLVNDLIRRSQSLCSIECMAPAGNIM